MNEFTAIADDYDVLPEGEYQAVFNGIEAPEEPGKFGPYLVWHFTAMTADGPVDVSGRSGRPERFTRSTKARLWYESLLGRPLATGETMSFGKLRGAPCRLDVIVRENEKGSSNRIEGVRRAPAAPTSRLAPSDLPPAPDKVPLNLDDLEF